MESARLTCPLAWSKKILASRREVEENYSHELRRWAGYQRYRLQLDEGKSAEPFRQILELMIRDAERQADIIDMNLSNTGEAPVGVLGRINNFEDTRYYPGLEKLMTRIADLRETIHRMNRSNNKQEGTRKIISSATEIVKEAWVKLQKERTLHLAENLSQFVTCLESRRTDRDDKYQVDIFSARQMKAAFKKLYPSWKQDVENHIGNTSILGEMDSGCSKGTNGVHIGATSLPHQCRCPRDVEGRLGLEKSKQEAERGERSSGDDCTRKIYLPTFSGRNLNSSTDFTAIPVMTGGNDRDVSQSIPANHSCNLKQVVGMMSRENVHKMAEDRRTLSLGLPHDSLYSAGKYRLPIQAEGCPSTKVTFKTPNTNQVTAERLRQFGSLEKHSLRGSKLNSNQSKSLLRKVLRVDSRNLFTKYPKIPSIPSNKRSSKARMSKASKLPVVQSKAAPIWESRSLLPHKEVSLYYHHSKQDSRKLPQVVKCESKPVIKAITVHLPSPG